MKSGLWLKTLVCSCLVLTLAFSVVGTGLAQPIPDGNTGANVAYDPITGALAFIGTAPGHALPSRLNKMGAAGATANATSFVSAYTDRLGLKQGMADLTLLKAGHSVNGRATTRYQQVYQGIPVFASSVIVNTTASGGLSSLSAKTSPALAIDIHPAIPARAATALALKATQKYENLGQEASHAGPAALQIYDARLLNGDGLAPRLVWKVTITAPAAAVSEVVLVDAHSGAIALHYNQIDTDFKTGGGRPHSSKAPASAARSHAALPGTPLISVYSYDHGLPGDESDSGSFICDQDTASSCLASGDTDIVDAYQYALDTYNFYYTQFGRDSIDDGGMPIVSSVHLLTNYQNAFWTSDDTGDGIPNDQMVYGDGFSSADDVVGHELTHGVTQFESGLIYFGQPGAINESMSDVFGELIDQTNGRGNDAPGVAWLLGEDIPGLGAIRNMADPPMFGDPDRILSPNFYLGLNDDGGVHTNSGVNNKAAFLMSEGGAFNGRNVVGIGIYKTAAIYYEVQTHLLGSGSNYFDLYYALNQACSNLVGSQPVNATTPISDDDCVQVKSVTEAVQMNRTKSAAVYPLAPFCPTGFEPKANGDLFFDDFESGGSKWVFGHNGHLPGNSAPSPDWFISTSDSASGKSSLVGGYVAARNDSHAAMAQPVHIPANGLFYLRFEHDDLFELSWNFDGGRVEYQKDGGNWIDALPLFSAGYNYNGTISNSFGNPLGGTRAFTYATMNYTSTRYALAALRGHNVKFRFRVGNDTSGLSTWYVDNVRIYQCIGIPTGAGLIGPANNALLSNLKPKLDWSNAGPNLHHYQLQVDNDPLFGSPEINVNNLTASVYKVTAPLMNNMIYYWRVRGFNANGTGGGWSPRWRFRTVLAAPTILAPAGSIAMPGPKFAWSEVAGASGYIIQISLTKDFNSLLANQAIRAPGSVYQPKQTLPAGKTLFWRVRATGPNGPSAWSAVTNVTAP